MRQPEIKIVGGPAVVLRSGSWDGEWKCFCDLTGCKLRDRWNETEWIVTGWDGTSYVLYGGMGIHAECEPYYTRHTPKQLNCGFYFAAPAVPVELVTQN